MNLKKIRARVLALNMKSSALTSIREKVIGEAKGVVLEIGVGPGYNIPLYKEIEKLYALEPSSELLTIADDRAKAAAFPLEILRASAEKIPLPDASVDTVVSTWTLCSVTDIDRVLDEIKRVLKTDGKFLFVDHGASPQPFVLACQQAFTVFSKRCCGNCHYTRDIEASIQKAGFTITHLDHPKEAWAPLIYNYQGKATIE